MKSKFYALVSILVAMVMILTACAKETEAPPPPPVEAEEITFVTQVSEAEEAAIEEIAALFEEQTGIEVNVQFMQATDMQALLQSQIGAYNITVDVMAQDNLRMEPFVRLGLIEDLSDLESDIDPAVFDGLIEGGKFDGKLFFVPYRTNVQLTYYRTDIFDELGMEPPSTWDEWRAACEAFLERDGEPRCLFKGAFDPTAVNPTQMWEWIVSAGGDPLVMNDAGTVAAYEFLQGLEQDGLLHPDSAIAKWDTSNESFARGDVYLMQNWPFGIGVIRDLGMTDFDVYHGVEGPEREAHVVGGEVLAIVKGTPRKDAAWKFVKFLESVAAQEILAAENGWPNVRGDALGQITEARMVEFETVNDALEYGILRPNILYMEELLGIMIEAYDRIVNDGEDAQTVLAELRGDLMVARGEDEEITFVTQVSEAEEAAIEEIAALFEEQTGIEVNVQFMQATDMQALLQSQIGAYNITVDVMAQDNLRMEPFVRLGLIEDLSDLESDIDPAVFDGLIEGGKFDGKLFFVPYRTNVQLTYYRTDIFDELGMEPPSTWDEWRAACEAFLERDGEPRCLFKGAFDPTAVNPTQMWEWIVSAGGDPLVMNDAGTVAAYEFLQGLEQDGLLHPDSAIAKWDTSNESFARGDVYLMQNWPFGIGVIRDLGMTDFDVYHGVEGPEREAHVVGGEVLAIVKGTPRKDAAWKFVKFLESVAAQEILAAENGWPNVRGDALGQITEARMVEFETVNDALEYGILRPNIPYMEDLLGIMIEAYDRIVNDGEDAETVLDELHGDLLGLAAEVP